MVLSRVHTVVGPLLFTPLLCTIYVNDLPSCINGILLLFADDTINSFIAVSPILMFDQLQDDIDVMMEWSKL